jgi:hypothetical protein
VHNAARDSLLDRALENNIALYRAVLGAHAVTGVLDAHAWSTHARVPPYYSNLITASPGRSAALQQRIASLSTLPGDRAWGMKDSFACFDATLLRELVGAPLRLLFEAQWYGRDTDDPTPSEASDMIEASAGDFERVQDAEGLAAWEEAWQKTSPTDGQRVFPAAALTDESLMFFRARGGAGALLNLSPGAVGISNVYPSSPALHREVARLAARLHPDRAIVGYGSHEDLTLLGIHPLGPLRVWLCNPRER